VSFVGAFVSADDFVGKDIIEQLAELSALHRPGYFNATVRCSKKAVLNQHVKQVTERLEGAKLEEVINDVSSKYYICGPPSFTYSVYSSLTSRNVPQDRIILT
jgi:NAD(P)H-flavin reductase